MKHDVKIRKVSTSEENVSLRSTSYDVYVDGEYVTSFKNVLNALDYKERVEKEGI